MATTNLGRIGFVPKGDWVAGTYKYLDVVRYNAKAYACKVNSTTSEPTTASDWMVLNEDTNGLSLNDPTNMTGLIKGNGSTVSVATAGTDYLTPSGNGSQLTNLNGSNITTGTVAAARLGSGSSITTKFLRGDNTWQTVSSGATIPTTTAILKGDNAGNAVAATAGTDYAGISTANSFTVDQTINGLKVGRGGGNVSSNTANGYNALNSNTTGTHNTANGYQALQTITAGSYNTAHGSQALYSHTTGANNTANGFQALYSNTTGYENTAVGYRALQANTTGVDNTSVGNGALFSNTTASNNTGVGYGALFSNTTGANNTAIGYQALNNNTTYSNCTGIGYNAQVGGSNQLRLGDSATTVYTQSGTVSASDARDKADIRDTVLGLDFINALRPVDYRWDIRLDYMTPMPEPLEIPEDATDEEKVEIEAQNKAAREQWLEENELANLQHDGTHKRVRFHHGLIAQEVETLIDETGVDFGGFQNFAVKGGQDMKAIAYEELIAPLIKAVQELNQRLVAAGL